MYLNRYGRHIGAARDLLEVPLVEVFPQVSPLGTPVVSWESGGEWFADADGGIERRRNASLRSRSVLPPGEVQE